MKSTELKFLANLAKQRLINKDYSTSNNIQTKNKASNYFIQNARALKKLKAETSYVTIKKDEDVEFIAKVKQLINEDCYNPLGVLCDYKYFETLDSRQKEFYILSLSEKYNKIKDEVMCG